MVDWLFETASSSGLRVARFFGHGHEDSSLVLQTSPGIHKIGLSLNVV